MAYLTWLGGSGNWDTDNWSGTSTYPTATDAVVVSYASSIVTINTAAVANTFYLDSTSAKVFDYGSLTLSGSGAFFGIGAGTFNIEAGGSISGANQYEISSGLLNDSGSIVLSGADLSLSSATLDVTTSGTVQGGYLYMSGSTIIDDGAITFSPTQSSSLTGINGIEVGATGTFQIGPMSMTQGSIDDAGSIVLSSTQASILHSVAITIESTGSLSGDLALSTFSTGTLTVGGVLALSMAATSTATNTPIVVTSTGSITGGSFTLSNAPLTDGGVIALSSNSLLTISGGQTNTVTSTGSITNGSISISGGFFNLAGSMTNSSGDSLSSNTYFTLASTGSISGYAMSFSGTVIDHGKITTSAAAPLVTGGNFNLESDATLSGTSFIISGGQFYNYGAINVTSSGVLKIGSGIIYDYDSVDLSPTSTLNLVGGTFYLASSATGVGSINGGVIVGNSSLIQYGGGVLDAVTFETAMNLAATSATIVNGLTLTGAGGTGSGPLNINGVAANFQGAQTLNNATINLGTTNSNSGVFLSDPNSIGNQTLILGPNVVVNALGHSAFFSTQKSVATNGTDTLTGQQVAAGDGIVSEGVINVATTFSETALNFTNKGTINITDGVFTTAYNFINASGGAIKISGTGTQVTLGASGAGYGWSNAGSISVGSGALLTLKGAISNTGTITVASGGELALYGGLTPPSTIILSAGAALDLYGAETSAQIENFVGKTFMKVRIYGALNNAGQNTAIGVGSDLPVFSLMTGGVVTGGTITPVGTGGVSFADGALSGVTWQGLMDLSFAVSRLIVKNGLTVTGSGGTGAGVINLTGATSYIAFQGTQTLDNVTINLGAAGGGLNQALDISDPTALGGQTLTLGAGVVIDVAGQADEIGDFEPGDATDSLVNDGVINAGAAGGVLTEDVYNFTNGGAINVTNGQQFNALYNFTNAAGATLAITGAGTSVALATSGGAYQWSNAGTITVGAGSILTLYGAYTNTGTISLASGATLNLRGTVTTAQIEAATTAGGAFVNVYGSLNNTGSVLTLGPGVGPGKLTIANGSSIIGGTIKDTGGGIVFNGLILKDVTYDGTMDMSAPGASVTIVGGLTANTLSGTGPGVIEVTGVGGDIYFQGTQTFDNASIFLGSGVGRGDDLILSDPTHLGGQVLTLGAGAAISAVGYYETIGTQDVTGTDSIINDGLIYASYAGGYLYETAANFTNGGVIKIRNGESFYAYDNFTNTGTLSLSGTGGVAYLAYNGAPYSFTNLVGGTLTGGVYQIGAGDTLYLPSSVSVLKADLSLSGAGSVVEANPSGPTIDQSLTEIGSGGVLRLAAGRDFMASNTVTIDLGGRLYGAGTFTGVIVDNSGIDAEGGVLAITGAVTGTGAAQIGANATLELGATASIEVTFESDATLALDDSAAFSGKIRYFAGGDTIDVKDIAYSGAAPSFTEDSSNTFGTLKIGGGAHTASIILFGQYIAADFHAASDGGAGQLITYAPPPPAAITPPGP